MHLQTWVVGVLVWRLSLVELNFVARRFGDKDFHPNSLADLSELQIFGQSVHETWFIDIATPRRLVLDCDHLGCWIPTTAPPIY
jgi:hypothetical protein